MKPKFEHSLKKSWEVVLSIFQNFVLHESPYWAASLAYYGLLSLFPILLFIIYFGSTVLESDLTREILNSLLAEFFPVGIDNINEVIDQTLEVRESIGLVGGIGLIWTGSSVFGVLAKALNAIWGKKPRSFLKRRIMAVVLLIVLGNIFLLFFFISPILQTVINSVVPEFKGVVVFGYELALISLTSLLLYRIFPNCVVSWKAASLGGIIGGLGIVIAKHLFVYYLSIAVNNYGYIYGSLTWIVFMLIWAFVVAVLFFLGAEVGAYVDGHKG